MKHLYRLFFAVLFVWVFGGHIQAQTAVPGEALRVLVKPVAPFVIPTSDGTAVGFSIDLWHTLEGYLGVEADIIVLPDLVALLEGVESGAGDMAIAAVTITSERETHLDFSHPYFRSGLQIMVPNSGQGMIGKALSVLGSMFASPSFRVALIALVVLVLTTAHVMWWVERRKNPDFTRSYPMGLWDGVYWTMVTISTVGYGDKTPKTHPGRVIALALMVFGYIAFAWFTATISSTMTVSRLEGEIRGPQDLAGKQVASIAGSTSESYLINVIGVRLHLLATIEEAYAMLEAGQVDAVVYDYPVLSFYASNEGFGKVRLVGEVFQKEVYGIVFPIGSQWRERVNQALLRLGEDGELVRLHQKWFAAEPK